MSKSFIQRRHKTPDYDIEVWITGARLLDGKTHWNVQVEGENDNETAACILERAVEVLRNESDNLSIDIERLNSENRYLRATNEYYRKVCDANDIDFENPFPAQPGQSDE